ncbi:uncharacterized protein [Pocillopora verrucosa]|uniref:uncharacterized protein isoform X2 n=1 Tax=Pocillopora verrucosa TaxID=203993 RepID=UPI003341D426
MAAVPNSDLRVSGRFGRIETSQMIHLHYLNKVPTRIVRRKNGITVESRCVVCRIGIQDPNVPENSFLCNFCLDFYMCETCFMRREYAGRESSWLICPADTMIVARLHDSPPGNECSICRIEIENSIAFYAVDELIERQCSFIACCRCIMGPINGHEGIQEALQRNAELADRPRQEANDGGPMLADHSHGLLVQEQFPQRRIIQRELEVQRIAELANQLGQEEAGNGPINGHEGIQEALQRNAELADRPRQEANGIHWIDGGPMLANQPHGLQAQEQFPQRRIIQRELEVQRIAELANQLGQEEAGNGPINGHEGIQEALQRNAELADRPRQEANGIHWIDGGPMLANQPHGLQAQEQYPQRRIIPWELEVQRIAELADQLGQEEAGNGPVNGPEGIQEALQGNAELADQPRQEEAANA